MRELLKVKDTFGGEKLIERVRLLDSEDFKIKESFFAPDSYKGERGRGRPHQYIHTEYVLTLKKEVFDHIMEVCAFNTFTNRRGDLQFSSHRDRDRMAPFASGWTPAPGRTTAGMRMEMKYRGISATDEVRRQKKYDKEKENMFIHGHARKDHYLNDKIQLLNQKVPLLFEEINENFDKSLASVVQELTVQKKWMDEHLTKEGKELEEDINQMDKQIAVLKAQRNGMRINLYAIKRKVVVASMLDEEFSPETKERIRELNREAPEIPESEKFSLSFS